MTLMVNCTLLVCSTAHARRPSSSGFRKELSISVKLRANLTRFFIKHKKNTGVEVLCNGWLRFSWHVLQPQAQTMLLCCCSLLLRATLTARKRSGEPNCSAAETRVTGVRQLRVCVCACVVGGGGVVGERVNGFVKRDQ